jgi:hypothetical protein
MTAAIALAGTTLWRCPELQYNIGAAVNVAAAAAYALALDANVFLISDGQAGNAVLAEHAVAAILADLAARELRGAGRVTEVIRRSGKFPAQLTRLETAGFTSYLLMREGDIVKPQLRPLGGDAPHQPDSPSLEPESID